MGRKRKVFPQDPAKQTNRKRPGHYELPPWPDRRECSCSQVVLWWWYYEYTTDVECPQHGRLWVRGLRG